MHPLAIYLMSSTRFDGFYSERGSPITLSLIRRIWQFIKLLMQVKWRNYRRLKLGALLRGILCALHNILKGKCLHNLYSIMNFLYNIEDVLRKVSCDNFK